MQVKMSNEEKFVTNAFVKCIGQNRDSQKLLEQYEMKFAEVFGDYNKMFDKYVEDKKNFKNPNQEHIDMLKP